MGYSFYSASKTYYSDVEIHDRDMNWITQSDIFVAEVSNPSLGVGYEISAAISLNKKIYWFILPNNCRIICILLVLKI